MGGVAGRPEALTVRGMWSRTTAEIGDRSAARWLCEVATGRDGDELVAGLDEPVTEQMVAHLDAMLARYRTGEPLQYVLGRWGFRRLDLAIDRRVLIPRPETEQVAGVAIDLAYEVHERDGRIEVVDLGTGSGAIGLSLAAELPLRGTTVWITDVDPGAIDVATANLAGLGRPAANVRVSAGSWFDALPTDLLADVIVSNPPYVAVDSDDVEAAVVDWEPERALFAGADGLDSIRAIVTGAPGALRADGWLVLEIGADQGAAVAELMQDHGFIDVEVRRDVADRDRVAIGRRPGIR